MFQKLLRQEIGDFQIHSLVQEGKGSCVCQAFHGSQGTLAAVKFFLPEIFEARIAQVKETLKNLVRLENTHLVKIFSMGEWEDLVWFAMEWIEGVTLRQWLQQHPKMDIPFIIHVLEDSLDSLDILRKNGLMHGNLKPENIWIRNQDNSILLSDPGLSGHAGSSQNDNLKIADARYTAPEQILQKKADIRTDLYSLGIILYEMMAGEPPYIANLPFVILQHHLTSPIPSLNQKNSEIPGIVDEYMQKLLAKSPEERFESPMQLRMVLKDIEGAFAPKPSMEMDIHFEQNPVQPDISPLQSAEILQTDNLDLPQSTEILQTGNSNPLQSAEILQTDNLDLPQSAQQILPPLQEQKPMLSSVPITSSSQDEAIPAALSLNYEEMYPFAEAQKVSESKPSDQEEKSPANRVPGKIRRTQIMEVMGPDSGKRKRFQIKRETKQYNRSDIQPEEAGISIPPQEVASFPSEQEKKKEIEVVPLREDKKLPFSPAVFSDEPNNALSIFDQPPRQPEQENANQQTTAANNPSVEESVQFDDPPQKVFSPGVNPVPEGQPVWQCSDFLAPFSGQPSEIGFSEQNLTPGPSVFSPTPVAPMPVMTGSSITPAMPMPAVPGLIPPSPNTEAPWQPMFQQNGVAGQEQDEVIFDDGPKIPNPYMNAPVPISVPNAPQPSQAGIPLSNIPAQTGPVRKTERLAVVEKEKATKPVTGSITVKKRRKKRQTPILSLCALILILAVGICLYSLYPEWFSSLSNIFGNESKNVVTNNPNSPTNNKPDAKQPDKLADKTIGWFGEKMPSGMIRTSTRGEYLWQKDKSIMVYVPAGTFWCGENPKTMKCVELPAYYIDKYEVTNEQYLEFVNNTGYEATPFLTAEYFNGARQPVVGISYLNAIQYAKWAEKRIPTEAEWEKAARGGLKMPDWQQEKNIVEMIDNDLPKRPYPWGNDDPAKGIKRANYNTERYVPKGTAIVGSFPDGASVYGCEDMVGNVWEWCAPDRPEENSKKKQKCRGGSWGSNTALIARRVLTDADKGTNTIGVRLAK